MNIPGLIIREQSADRFRGRYNLHDIGIERDTTNQLFYIIVTHPSGVYDYDGWWEDSEEMTIEEAVVEAIRGAMIDEEAVE